MFLQLFIKKRLKQLKQRVMTELSGQITLLYTALIKEMAVITVFGHNRTVQVLGHGFQHYQVGVSVQQVLILQQARSILDLKFVQQTLLQVLAVLGQFPPEPQLPDFKCGVLVVVVVAVVAVADLLGVQTGLTVQLLSQ
jgi:hypothetical protein